MHRWLHFEVTFTVTMRGFEGLNPKAKNSGK
jgi:hypothetical protein